MIAPAALMIAPAASDPTGSRFLRKSLSVSEKPTSENRLKSFYCQLSQPMLQYNSIHGVPRPTPYFTKPNSN